MELDACALYCNQKMKMMRILVHLLVLVTIGSEIEGQSKYVVITCCV